jgi:hypothetical protein
VRDQPVGATHVLSNRPINLWHLHDDASSTRYGLINNTYRLTRTVFSHETDGKIGRSLGKIGIGTYLLYR